jgi:hypothetical protein
MSDSLVPHLQNDDKKLVMIIFSKLTPRAMIWRKQKCTFGKPVYFSGVQTTTSSKVCYAHRDGTQKTDTQVIISYVGPRIKKKWVLLIPCGGAVEYLHCRSAWKNSDDGVCWTWLFGFWTLHRPVFAFILLNTGRWIEFRNQIPMFTSTVALRVVGGDENGSLESEIVKYGHESHETRTREWLPWRGPAAIVSDRPVFSSERAPHINNPATVWQ